jgi:hypothetical protein
MTPARSAPTRAEEPPALHDRAMDNLRFIRETMERAGSFTAVSGWGEVAIGLTALAAAYVAARQAGFDEWLVVWLVEACLSLVIAGSAMIWKARTARIPLLSGPGQKFALSFSPPILVGAILTAVLYRAGTAEAIPGTWLLLYGTAVVTGGASSVRVVVLMGVAFMLAGAAALFSPPAWGDIFMAGGFGGLHIAFGAVIARKHGG